MSQSGTNNSGQDEIRLHDGQERHHQYQILEALTLYVMKTSIKKNDTKTLAPYRLARIIRETNGTGILPKHQ